jgi:hypothetical protein
MSEPTTIATGFDEVVPGVRHFQIQDERIHHISDAYALAERGKVVLVDPLPVEAAVLRRLGAVEAIVVGTPNHQRSAWRYRRQTGAKVWAPAGSQGLEETPDEAFEEGALLPGGLRALHAPGPKGPHFVFHLERAAGVLFCSDLMLNEPGAGVIFLRAKYLAEPERAPVTARRLLDLDFETLCFGHGAPIPRGGREAVEGLLRRVE